MIRFLCIIALAAVAFGMSRCLDPGNPFRAGNVATGVSGTMPHQTSLGGVRHASSYCRPIPACTVCHGDSLQGGVNGEPSCTSCHGENWKLPTCGSIVHTVNLGGQLHAPNYCTPLSSCTTCHGSQLQGGLNGEPSCTSCHGEKWKESDCGD